MNALPLLLALAQGGTVVGLDDAIRTARAHQPQLVQARDATAVSAAQADEAFAPLMPQVTGTAGYSRSTANFAPRPGALPASLHFSTSSLWTSYDYWSSGLNASLLVWDFGQTRGAWDAARSGYEAQRQTERATWETVLLQVRTAFFAARAARDLVRVARDTLANLQAHLDQTTGFVQVGTQPEIAPAQSRADLANGRVQLIAAENNYETAKAQLNLAMGIEGSTDYDVGDDRLLAVEGEGRPLDALLEEAIRARPEVASIEAQIRAQEATLGSVRAGLLPSLGVSTGVTDAGPTLSSTVWNWTAAATLTWYLYQGGLTLAQLRQAEASADAARSQLVGLRQQIRLDVDTARRAVLASLATLDAARDALVNSKELLRLAEGRYQTGAGNIIELGDAQVAETTAAAQMVQADFNLSAARAKLLQVLARPAPGDES